MDKAISFKVRWITTLLGIICLLTVEASASGKESFTCGVEVKDPILFGHKFPVKVWLQNESGKPQTIDAKQVKYIIRCLKPFRQSTTPELYSSATEFSTEKNPVILRKGEKYLVENKIDVPESGLYEISVQYVTDNGRTIKKEKEIRVIESKLAIKNAFKILGSKEDALDRVYALRCLSIMADETANLDLLKQLRVESEQSVQLALCEVLLARLFPGEIHVPIRLHVNEPFTSYEIRANQWIQDAKNKIGSVLR